MFPNSPALRGLVCLTAALLITSPAGAVTLGVQGTRFTLDGRPTFLLGASYYAGIGASDEALRSDLDQLKVRGFNWIRVWATWAAFGNDVSAVDADGKAREPQLSRLRQLVAEADRRGIVVDVTLSRGDGKNDSPRLQSLEAHRRAVETLIGALGRSRNWYLDLSNERNIGDARHTSFEDLTSLRAEARKRAPGLLVTASQGGDITREEVEQYLKAGMDLLTPHRPRDPESPGQTAAKTRAYLAWCMQLGRPVPIHYQEPFRRGYAGWEPVAIDIVTDLNAARAGGAAGWCFHNGSTRTVPDGRPRRSFDLRDGPLFRQLDPEERRAVDGLSHAAKS
jgi:hypothetical protein